MKRVLGSIILAVGVLAYLFGMYISQEVGAGKKKLAHAERSVSKGKELTDIIPYTEGLGDLATAGAEKKIDEGKKDVETYTKVAEILHMGGVILFIGGALLVVMSFTNKKKG
ncbi:MAG: hypothetical protein FJZ59_01770 [Chlamydiae bacterium]|jgi:uncharacterized membrane protein|nr:hypothetical protein [Chlamydiota bacterium]